MSQLLTARADFIPRIASEWFSALVQLERRERAVDVYVSALARNARSRGGRFWLGNLGPLLEPIASEESGSFASSLFCTLF